MFRKKEVGKRRVSAATILTVCAGVVIGSLVFLGVQMFGPSNQIRAVAADYDASAWELKRVTDLIDLAHERKIQVSESDWEDMVALTNHESPLIRKFAYYAVREVWGTPFEARAYELLERMRKDNDLQIRDEYVSSLAIARHPQWRVQAENAMSSHSKGERENAEWALSMEEKWVRVKK